MALFATCAMLTAGPCQIDAWKLAVGPVFSGDSAFAGVELEFSNDIDLLVPLFPLG